MMKLLNLSKPNLDKTRILSTRFQASCRGSLLLLYRLLKVICARLQARTHGASSKLLAYRNGSSVLISEYINALLSLRFYSANCLAHRSSLARSILSLFVGGGIFTLNCAGHWGIDSTIYFTSKAA